MAKEFVGMTPEEIAALPVFPEPGQTDGGTVQTDGGTVQTDGGTIAADGRGYVYFMTESGNNNYFKVGKTGDPNTRCMNLQTGNPKKLKMEPFKVARMGAVEKRVLKAMTAEYGKTNGGKEWFSGDVKEAYDLFLTILRGG